MAFDLEGARRAGYSDDEIAGFLSQQQGFDLAGAREAGYQPSEVLGFLAGSGKPAEPTSSTDAVVDYATAATDMQGQAPRAPAQPKKLGPAVKPEGRWDLNEGSWPDDRSEAAKGVASAVTGIKSMKPAAGIAGSALVVTRIGERLANWDKIDRGEFVPRAEGLAYQQADAAGRQRLREELLAVATKQKGFIKESAELVKRYQSEQRANRGKTADFTDIEDVKGFADWLEFNGAAGAVYLAPVMVSAALGGVPGAAAMSYALAAGEINADRVGAAIDMASPQRFSNPDRQEAAAAGREQTIAARVAETVPQTAAFAVPSAALDVVAGPVRNVLSKPLKDLTKKEVLQRAPGMAGRDIVEEGLTGAAQEGVNIAAEGMAGERAPDATIDDDLKRILNAGMAEAAGGPTGTAVNVAGALATTPRASTPSPAQPTDTEVIASVASAPSVDDAIRTAEAVVQQQPVAPARPEAAEAVDNIGRLLREAMVGQPSPALNPEQPQEAPDAGASTGLPPLAAGTDRGGSAVPGGGLDAGARADGPVAPAVVPGDAGAVAAGDPVSPPAAGGGTAAAAVAEGLAKVWTGRRGDGYQSQQDAANALPTRQKVEPNLNWKIEQRGDRFVLAGYERAAPITTPEGWTVSRNDSGTVNIKGDPQAIGTSLQRFGITKYATSPSGVMVGLSQADAAMQALRRQEQGAGAPETGRSVAEVQAVQEPTASVDTVLAAQQNTPLAGRSSAEGGLRTLAVGESPTSNSTAAAPEAAPVLADASIPKGVLAAGVDTAPAAQENADYEAAPTSTPAAETAPTASVPSGIRPAERGAGADLPRAGGDRNDRATLSVRDLTTAPAAAVTPETPAPAGVSASDDDRFPNVEKFDKVNVGPGGFIKPRAVAPDRPTYRETSVSGLDDRMRDDRDRIPFNSFVADRPELAIGQGLNRGVQLQFRPGSVSGREHAKPMTGDLTGREYATDLLAPRAVQAVTMFPADLQRARGLTRQRLAADFDRQDLPDGRVHFTRKGLPPLPPPTLEAIPFTRNASGTLTVEGGDLVLARKILESAGVQRITTSKKGLLVGKSDAEKAAAALERLSGKPEPTEPVESLGATGKAPAGGKNARAQVAEANPFRAFLGKHGLSLDLVAEFAPGTKERRAAMVRGWGPIFRKSGKQLDALAQAAFEEGFLPSADADRVYELVAASMRGERVTPQYTADGAERGMADRIERQRLLEEEEAIAALDALEDNELAEVEAVALDAPSNISEAEAMRLLGFTEQEISDAVAQQAGEQEADGTRRGGAGEAAAAQAQGTDRRREGQAPAIEGLSDGREDSSALASDPAAATAAGENRGGDVLRAVPATNTLTSPTPEEVVAQQERRQQGERAEAQQRQDGESRARADADRGDFGLTGSDRPADADPKQRGMFARAEAESAASRTRPRSTIEFKRPITGPSGAKLVSYTWQWKPIEFVDKLGEERTARISDWDKSETNAETGRDVVHQFVVQDAEGNTQTVSAETAMRQLGYADGKAAGQFKSVASAAKTLARLRMQQVEVNSALDAYRADWREVESMALPPMPTERDEKGWWHLGDASVRQTEAGPMTAERKRALVNNWQNNRLSERGWRGGSIAGDSLQRQAGDLADRIKRAEKKLDALTPATVMSTAPQASGDQNRLFKQDDRFEAFRRSAIAANAPLSVEKVRFHVDQLTKGWENAPKIHVVANHLDLPVRAPKTARGFYNGEVWIVARLQKNRDQVARTLAHEAIAHHGLENILGPEQWSRFEKGVELAIKAGNAPLKAAAEFVDRAYGDLSPHERTHEIAARVIEDAVDPKTGEFRPGYAWLKATWAKVADWLRSIGIEVKFTNAELHGMLVMAQRSLEVGRKLAGGGEVMVGAAQDDGLAARADVTETPEFRRWFGDSKVVDVEGKPLKMYHGTQADFSRFDQQGFGVAHFTASPSVASDFAIDVDGKPFGGRVMPVYLKIRNPLRIKDHGGSHQSASAVAESLVAQGVLPADYVDETFYGRLIKDALGNNEKFNENALEELRRIQGLIEQQGYDGIVYNNTGEGGGDAWIAFHPEQVKSAIGNRGTFDPKDPNILFALADTEADQQDDAAPQRPATSPWRDATGRLQFAPGAWLFEKMGAAAGPLLSKLQLKAASPELRRALREMKLQVARAQETAAAVAGEAMKLTADERAMVSDLIEQELAAGVTPPEHAVRLAAMINASMGAQTDELVRLGMLTPESAEMWRDKYLPRFYRSKLGKQVTDAWADAVQRMLGRTKVMAGIKGKHLRGRGLFETIPERELPHWEDMGWQVRDPGFQPGLTDDGTVQVWRDFSAAERQQMGEIRDAGFRFVMGYMQTQRDIALGRLFEGLAQDPDMSGKRETDAFRVQVPDGTVPGTGAKRYGKLAGRWVSKDTMSHLSQIEEAQSDAWKMYRQAMGKWKEGKALALDTPIPTPAGWTTMGDIKVGDSVFDERGQPCTVTYATDVQLNRTCYEVEFSDGAKIVADEEHLWFTLYRRQPGVRNTKQILDTLKERTRGDNNHSVPVAHALELPEAALPVPPYVLGAWLGDGATTSARITVGAADSAEMQAHLAADGIVPGAVYQDARSSAQTFQMRLRKVGCLRGHGPEHYHSARGCTVCDTERQRAKRAGVAPAPATNGQLSRRIRDMGLFGEKRIPREYLRASTEQRRALLQGLMDTDGYTADGGHCEFTTTLPALRDGMLELLRSLGYKAVSSETRATLNGRDCGPKYRVRFAAYADAPVFRLARKLARLPAAPEARQRSGTRQIVAIRPVASVPVRCIQVDSDSRLYLAGEAMIPTHNTSLNPVAHVNNILSNTSMAHFAGVSYWEAHKYLAAARDFAFKAEGVKEAKDAGLFLGTLSDAELMNVLPEDLKALVRQQDSSAKKIGRTAFDVMTFFLRRPLGWAYQAEDTFFRYLIYKDARGRGMEPGDAVDYAQKFIFAYDDLPKGARMARDVWVPFFGYTYKVIPALLETALTHPIRFATPAAVLFAANAISYAVGAGEDEGDEWDEALRKYLTDEAFRAKVREKEKLERELLPKWMRGTTALFTPRAIRLGMDEVTKLPVFADVSRIIPGGDVFDVSPNADGIPVPQWMMPSNPLLTTVIAMTANKDLYFGKELVDANDTKAEASEKRLAWLWRQASPAIAVGNYHFERGMNALAQASGGEVTWLPEWLSEDYTGIGRDGLPVQPKYAAMQTFGLKVRPLDLEMSERIENSQRQKLLRDIDAEMRRLRRLNNSGALSDKVYERERNKADEKKDRIRQGLTVDGNTKD